MFWGLNPRTLEPFNAAYRMRLEREIEAKISEMDIAAWSVGSYVRSAIVSAFNDKVEYPSRPVSLQKQEIDTMTGKDHAEQFRTFLKHYKRPPVTKQGGETHGG